MSSDDTHRPLIVVGVDGSDQSRTVLRWATGYAQAVNGELRAVLAWQFPELPGYVPPRVESDLSVAAEKVLADLVAESAQAVRVETTVQEGSPVRLLLREARAADLLVVGRHGHGRDGGKMLGSVAQSCALQAQCPVVVVPAATG